MVEIEKVMEGRKGGHRVWNRVSIFSRASSCCLCLRRSRECIMIYLLISHAKDNSKTMAKGGTKTSSQQKAPSLTRRSSALRDLPRELRGPMSQFRLVMKEIAMMSADGKVSDPCHPPFQGPRQTVAGDVRES